MAVANEGARHEAQVVFLGSCAVGVVDHQAPGEANPHGRVGKHLGLLDANRSGHMQKASVARRKQISSTACSAGVGGDSRERISACNLLDILRVDLQHRTCSPGQDVVQGFKEALDALVGVVRLLVLQHGMCGKG